MAPTIEPAGNEPRTPPIVQEPAAFRKPAAHDDDTGAGFHIGPDTTLTERQREQIGYLHARGFLTIEGATFDALETMGFDVATMRTLPRYAANASAWWHTVRAGALT